MFVVEIVLDQSEINSAQELRLDLKLDKSSVLLIEHQEIKDEAMNHRRAIIIWKFLKIKFCFV